MRASVCRFTSDYADVCLRFAMPADRVLEYSRSPFPGVEVEHYDFDYQDFSYRNETVLSGES